MSWFFLGALAAIVILRALIPEEFRNKWPDDE